MKEKFHPINPPLQTFYNCHHFFFSELFCLSMHFNSLQNSGAKYDSNKMLRQFQNSSVCFGNTPTKKLPKIQQKPLHITSAMVSAHLGILSKAMICCFFFRLVLPKLSCFLITRLNV